MPAAQVTYKLSKDALRLIQQGRAEFTIGGIRDVNTKRIIELAKPVAQNVLSQKEMMQAMSNSLKAVQSLSWVNIAISLVNMGVSVVGFYQTLTRLEASQGEIRKFIERYNSDKDADYLEKYKSHLNKITSQLNFLQNRYVIDDYNKQIFIQRETDIEEECNEAESFLERTLMQYQKGEVSETLACQIIFTLSPVYAQLVNEYCCQFYNAHNMSHQQLNAWKDVLDQINSESFRNFMKRQMAFNVQYVQLSPQRRLEVLTVAFECVQEIIDNITTCAEVIKTAPRDELIPIAELLNEKAWNDIRDSIVTENNETPEEFFVRQLNQIAINDDGEEEIYIPLQVSYA